VDRVNLAKLDMLCDKAYDVAPLGELAADCGTYFKSGAIDVIGMRHDCDDRAFDSILPLAEWENRRGRRSTFYLLHTAPWYDRALEQCLPTKLAALGHEVGLHLNWVPAYERYGVSGHDVLKVELAKLRSSVGARVPIRSVAGHGDDACYRTKLVNYSMFIEAGAPRDPWRGYEVATGYAAHSLREYGLDFLGEFVSKAKYVSDSGDEWSTPLSEITDEFPYDDGPLVILQHPDWYRPELFA
jgi:hypothetical protein